MARFASPKIAALHAMFEEQEHDRRAAADQEREALNGLPAEAKDVLTLQLKATWTKTDRARVALLTREWTPAHKQAFEDSFSIGRAMRWPSPKLASKPIRTIKAADSSGNERVVLYQYPDGIKAEVVGELVTLTAEQLNTLREMLRDLSSALVRLPPYAPQGAIAAAIPNLSSKPRAQVPHSGVLGSGLFRGPGHRRCVTMGR